MDTTLLTQIAEALKTGHELTGSKWQNSEAETIACQTIRASASSYKKSGFAMSWQGENTQKTGAMQLLLDDKSLELISYSGSLKPPKDTVHDLDGKPMVFLVTDKLLHYAAAMVL